MVKAYVLGIVQGVQQINWFEAKEPTSTTTSDAYGFGLLDVDENPRLSWYAYQAMVSSMTTHPVYSGWLGLGPEGSGYGLVFDANGIDVMAAWMPKGREANINFGTTVEIVNIFDNTSYLASSVNLTDIPVFIFGLPSSMANQAAVNKSLPFAMWGSLPVSSTRAQIELGQVSLARGIEVDRAGTLVPNGSGTNGVIVNQSGDAAYLSVVPAFANYDTSNVYIRVTAHQESLRTSGYSGMNLFFQPVTGSATSAPQYPYTNVGQWKGLVNNLLPQTFTWHLTNAMFTHTFGYSFYLKFDASVPFVIDKVEISTVPF
jgi:hypothetical protein